MRNRREYIEYAFNVYKNNLGVDSMYLQDEHMVFSYMFLNMLSLYIHFQVMNMMDVKESVRDVLLILSTIKIYRYGNREMVSEISKKANDIITNLKINIDILRKNQ